MVDEVINVPFTLLSDAVERWFPHEPPPDPLAAYAIDFSFAVEDL